MLISEYLKLTSEYRLVVLDLLDVYALNNIM